MTSSSLTTPNLAIFPMKVLRAARNFTFEFVNEQKTGISMFSASLTTCLNSFWKKNMILLIRLRHPWMTSWAGQIKLRSMISLRNLKRSIGPDYEDVPKETQMVSFSCMNFLVMLSSTSMTSGMKLANVRTVKVTVIAVSASNSRWSFMP